MARVINFSAGPATLPLPVLEYAHNEFFDHEGTGMSLIEHSHRGAAYAKVHEEAKALLRELQNQNGRADQVAISTVSMEPWFVPESTDCLGQLQEFRSRKEHFALVVDEYGALQGVVTLEDIVEEIVGEIDDEHDIPVAGIDRQADGSAIVDGTVTIRDLNREMDWALPDEDATTIAGLLMRSARLIPEQGQQFEFFGYRFEVLNREAQKISTLRITPSG